MSRGGREVREPWTKAFVDGHVHLQPSFDIRRVLDTAARNVTRQVQAAGNADHRGVLGVLMLAEPDGVDRFDELRTRMHPGDAGAPRSVTEGQWQLGEAAGRHPGLLASREGVPEILLVPGRQVRSHERLEVLFLNSQETHADDRPLHDVIGTTQPTHVLVVLAWGVGKWLGRRGRIVDRVIRTRASDGGLMLGDNGGRPVCWTEPSQFRTARQAGLKVLRGSDPLDLPGEEQRVGSFGALVEAVIPRSDPVATIVEALRDPGKPLQDFGHLQRNARFLRNQLGLRRRRPVPEPQP